MTSAFVRYVGASLATLTLTAGISTTVLAAVEVSDASASPDASATKTKAKPKPKPNVSARGRRWGSSLEGSTAQNGRREVRDDTETRHAPEHKATASDNRHSRRFPKRDSREELRINIGICGRMQPDGTVPGPARCQPGGDERRPTRRSVPPSVVIPRPEDITWEQVRSETKNVIFPGLSVKVQPSGRTLVNMATVVYTDDSKVSTTTVTLLGFPVVVEATPISYTWDFGDGSPTVTTSTPGKPYPAADITHKYKKREGVGITVTTNYVARFNVADTGWQYIEGTVPITGPATLLQVREAVPVLVDPGR